MKNTSLDAKREEFRKYLEKEGVLEYLTKHLVPLYDKADNPTSALEYLENNFAGKEVEEAKQKPETLESENRDLKKNVERLETEKNALTSEVAVDAKREEFRKYLEKEDVLEYLTKHLVPLYEKADKPTSALEYLKNNFAGKEVEEAKQKPTQLLEIFILQNTKLH